MIKVTTLSLFLFVMVLLTGCSSENKNTIRYETEKKVSSIKKDEVSQAKNKDTSVKKNQPLIDSKDDKEAYTSQETTNHPPKIKKIEIEVVDGNPRNGFRVHVVAEDPEGDDISYIYQWKLNGEDIIGATEKYLPWQENFKKGDIISVEVIPYDEYAEGIWKAEGLFKIPNSPPVINVPQKGSISTSTGKLSYKIEAYDPDGDPITLSLRNAPEGMTINPDTGEISWTFSEENTGDYKIEIVVTDSEGAATIKYMYFSIGKY